MATNHDEAITLRNNINKAAKATANAVLAAAKATADVQDAATKANAAEAALQKADPTKDNYNDIAKAYNDAEAKLASAVESENKAWAAVSRAEADLTVAKDRAKAAYSI